MDRSPKNGNPDSGELLVVGLSHRSAPFGLRDRLYLETGEQPRLLAEIGAAGIAEACVLSTCDRIEVVAVHREPMAAATELLRILATRAETEAGGLLEQSYHYEGEEALRHVFAVCASLDSQVIGEPQVLGQVKESHRLAAAAGMTGPTLEAVLQAAYGAAKRVRSETPVAQQPVSIVTSTLLVVRNLHGEIGRCNALLLGLGEMSELFGFELRDAGVADLVVMHGSAARAEAAAHRLQCHFRPWEQLEDAVTEADIVVASTGSGRYTIEPALVQAALKRRRRKPILFIDAAVPGDVDPAVEKLDGAFVYDLDDLERVAREGKASREATAVAAWRILNEEIDAFLRQRAERAAVPAVSALRRHFEGVRAQILSDGKLDAEAATRLLVNRLLHDPSEVLREAAARPESEATQLERSVERLFRIRKPAAASSGGDDKT